MLSYFNNLIIINRGRYNIIHEHAIVNISNNDYIVRREIHNIKYSFYPPCYFQYMSKRGNLDNDFVNGVPLNYSIVLNNDSSIDYLEQLMIHCYWLPGSAFNTTNPYDVYKKFVKKDFPLMHERIICHCVSKSYKDCRTHVLATIYPGQVITTIMAINPHYLHKLNKQSVILVEIDQDILPRAACKLTEIDEVAQPINNYCNPTKYTIIHSQFSDTSHWCELFIAVKYYSLNNDDSGFYYNLFYVKFFLCPPGFVQLNGACICDPLLNSKLLSIITCDINHQTILRPTNTWLFAVTINNSHQYHISPHCPLQYCLPHSSRLNFSTPNSQCQFNRSGLLCGQCQQGLSTVFVPLNVNTAAAPTTTCFSLYHLQ